MEDKEEKIRLNKYIALCGICSRREADKLIEERRIKVNGDVAEAGLRIGEEDIVTMDDSLIKPLSDHVVLAYNKPVGVVCTEKDDHAERTIIEDINYNRRITYAGRLDKDSEGLMILTDDGELIQAMMKSRNGHEKEYVVEVDRKIGDRFLKELEKGVYLSELDIRTKPCKTFRVSDKCFRIILTQGLNRQIRRMCNAFGYEVTKLKRVRVVNIRLDGLEHSEYREIKGEELKELYRLCGVKQI